MVEVERNERPCRGSGAGIYEVQREARRHSFARRALGRRSHSGGPTIVLRTSTVVIQPGPKMHWPEWQTFSDIYAMVFDDKKTTHLKRKNPS